jgi:hypothetical protein
LDKKVKFVPILFLIIIINAAALLLKYNGLDTYIILGGFRFYLSLTLPFIIICRNSQLGDLKKIFICPAYNKSSQPLGWIFLPLIVLFAYLYLSKQIAIGDPDYFYEFGLSSIFDYPIYIIWNLPQLLMFALFLILIQPLVKGHLLFSFFIALSCFAFIFVSFNSVKIDYLDISSLLFLLASAVLIVRYYQNVYWFSIVLFTIPWSNILVFGSGSQTLIHILFASKYKSWDGFFEVSKNIHQYLLTAQSCLTMVLIACSVFFRKTKPDIVYKKY